MQQALAKGAAGTHQGPPSSPLALGRQMSSSLAFLALTGCERRQRSANSSIAILTRMDIREVVLHQQGQSCYPSRTKEAVWGGGKRLVCVYENLIPSDDVHIQRICRHALQVGI